MDQVSDIVGLPHLDDSGVQEGVISSKRKRDDTLPQLYEFDATQTYALSEWHLVSRASQFKYWNIGAEEIKDLRTAIIDVKFVNPNGVHGGLGSTKAHNELLAIIDTSSDYNTFVRRLNNWANYRLEGGVSSLPQGLRLE